MALLFSFNQEGVQDCIRHEKYKLTGFFWIMETLSVNGVSELQIQCLSTSFICPVLYYKNTVQSYEYD